MLNTHPVGRLIGLGRSPCSTIRSRVASICGSGTGTADISACVYGMQWLRVEGLAIGDLDDAAEVHHGDAVRHLAHDRQVVGDEDVGDAELVLQVLQQVDDLRLDRHVERRHRLVADHDLGTQGDGAGDADALSLAAGELVGVAVVVLGVEPDALHRLLDGRFTPPSGLMPCTSYGAAMIDPTVCRGFRDENGSWKIICSSRRSGTISRLLTGR